MTATLLPIIRQMHEAADDRARARVLLAASDLVLMRHREVFEQACARAQFDVGLHYIDVRRASWHAVRGNDGQHKNPLFEDMRQAMADFASGGG